MNEAGSLPFFGEHKFCKSAAHRFGADAGHSFRAIPGGKKLSVSPFFPEEPWAVLLAWRARTQKTSGSPKKSGTEGPLKDVSGLFKPINGGFKGRGFFRQVLVGIQLGGIGERINARPFPAAGETEENGPTAMIDVKTPESSGGSAIRAAVNVRCFRLCHGILS